MIFDQITDSEGEEEDVGSLELTLPKYDVRRGSRDNIVADDAQYKSSGSGLLKVQATGSLSRSAPALNFNDTDSDSDNSRSASPRPNFLLVGDPADSFSSVASSVSGARHANAVDTEFPRVASGLDIPYRRASEDIAAWVHAEVRDEREETPQPMDDHASALAMENKLLYLMVARCISYSFNAKHQLETSPLKKKLNLVRYNRICQILQLCLEGNQFDKIKSEVFLSYSEQMCLKNKHFLVCVEDYVGTVLQRDDVSEMCRNGKFSAKELDTVFRVLAMKHLAEINKPPPTLQKPLHDGDELQLWCNTFRKLVEQSSRSSLAHPSSPMTPIGNGNGSAAPSQDMLYKMFQRILNIKPVVHQDIYRICQLHNEAEQEAVIRKELQRREQRLKDKKTPLVGIKFGSNLLETIYRDEQLKVLKQLTDKLDHLTLSSSLPSGYGPHQPRKRRVAATDSIIPPRASQGNALLVKDDLHLSLKVKVTVHEVSAFSLPLDGKPIFCVFELVDSSSDSLQTHPVVPNYDGMASFAEAGVFWTHSPLPQVKFTLRTEKKTFLSEDKVLAKKVYQVMPSTSEIVENIELLRNEKDPRSLIAKLKVSVFLDRPSNMKKCGRLMCSGSVTFRQWRRRFFTLMQLSQYKFVLCSYTPRDTQPKEYLVLDEGYTVDYFTPEEGEQLPELEESTRYMFALHSKEGQLLKFACRDVGERNSWVQWMVRATGSDNPARDETDESKPTRDLDRNRVCEAVESDITEVDSHKMFVKLFQATLKSRLNEDVFSRGLFSPAQMYVIDEFCARYLVRDSFRHLTCLKEWVECELRSEPIWPVMLLSSFRFCQMHVGKLNPPEKSVIVTREEQEALTELSVEIERVVTWKIENFRTCFPFGCPKDDLKVIIKLFNLVAAMTHSSINDPSGRDDSPMKVLTIALERAALINYKQVFAKLEIEDESVPLSMPQLFELGHLGITFMYELHDFYWEDFSQVAPVFTSHIDAFWSFHLVDIQEAMKVDKDIVTQLHLFHEINRYLCSQPTLKLGHFHRNLMDTFIPVVVEYINRFEVTQRVDLAREFSVEKWLPPSNCCGTVRGVVKALTSLRGFINQLGWPEEIFGNHLDQRFRSIAIDRFEEAADYTLQHLHELFVSLDVTLKFILPEELFTMINTLVCLNQQVLQVCSPQTTSSQDTQNETDFGTNIEEHLSNALQMAFTIVMDRLCGPLSRLLTKLAKYDPSDSLLASLKLMVSTNIPVEAYGQYLDLNLVEIDAHLVPAIFSTFLGNWYECQMVMFKSWLSERPLFMLQSEQQEIITTLTTSIHDSFGSSNLPGEQLESESYLAVKDRLRKECSKDDLLTVGKS